MLSSVVCQDSRPRSLTSWALLILSPTEPPGVREELPAVVGRAAATEMTLALVHGRLRAAGLRRCGVMACCSWRQVLPGLKDRALVDSGGAVAKAGPGAVDTRRWCGVALSAAWWWMEAVCSVMEAAASEVASRAPTREVAEEKEEVEGVRESTDW